MDHEINLWDVDNGEKLAFLPGTNTASPLGRISFPAEGVLITFQFTGGVKKWNVRPSGNPFSKLNTGASSENTSLPMVLVPASDDTRSILQADDVGLYHHVRESDWILDRRNRRMCWIPSDRRASSDFYGKKIWLGTGAGRLVMLDFSDISS